MTLTTNQPNPLQTGVIVGQVTIVSADDISGITPPQLSRPVDIGLQLTLDVGKSFQPTMCIAGNFRLDEKTEEVVSWGGAWIVKDFLLKMGYSGSLDPGNKIPQAALDMLRGKTFLRLSYVSGLKQDGRLRYSDFNQVATVEEGSQSLTRRFQKSVEKGYPKNYKPELLGGVAPSQPIEKEEDPF